MVIAYRAVHTLGGDPAARRRRGALIWRLLLVMLLVAAVLFIAEFDQAGAESRVFETRVAASADDAEEAESGRVTFTSSDLELTLDGSKGHQLVGVRFSSVDVPPGAQIDAAYVQFQADETGAGPTDLMIEAEAVDDALPFARQRSNLSQRARTATSVAWAPASWDAAGDAGPAQRTPSLVPLIQEIVDRPGWTNGNALALIVSGSGKRVAESFNGDASGAPLLHIEYTSSTTAGRPVAVSDEAVTVEDTSVEIDVLSNDSDPDGDPISVESVGAPGHGSVINHHDGTVTYTPDDNHHGQDSFTYTITDGTDTAIATVTVVIGAVNDAPTATDDSVSTPGDTAVTIEVLENDSDVDGDALFVAGIGDPGHGLVTNQGDGTLTYTPDPGFTGTDTFTYTATDGALESNTATVTIVVSAEGGTPNAVERRIAYSADDVEQRADGRVSLTSSDLELVFDKGGDQTVGLRFRDLAIPERSTITAAYIQFTADEKHTGPTDLVIRAEAADHAPVFTKTAGGVGSRPLTAASVEWSPPGWTKVGAAGADQRTPDLSPIVQEVVDRAGWASGNALVVVVEGTGERTAESFNGDSDAAPLLHVEFAQSAPVPNRAPEASDDTVTTTVDRSVIVDALANDADPDGNLDPSSSTSQCANCAAPTNGSVTDRQDGSFTYTPFPGFVGSDGFGYEVCDTDGLCDTASVAVDVITEDAQISPPLGPGFVCDHVVPTGVSDIDGTGNYAAIAPGDIVCLQPGTRGALEIRDIHGTPGNQVTIVNSGGVVTIEGAGNFAGIEIENSDHLRITGSGEDAQCGAGHAAASQACGISITGSQRGVAANVRSEQLEVDHIEMSGHTGSGVTVKDDALGRDEWVLRNVVLHHNYLHDIGDEGMYIGSSFYATGEPHVLEGIVIGFNLVTGTGRDGIQVGSAVASCAIHDNEVRFSGGNNESSHRAGIMNNRGSVCDIYNNHIYETAGWGIYVQGNGGNEIYNNVVVRAGRLVDEGSGGGRGIVVQDGSNVNQSIYVWNNTVVSPRGEGIGFRSDVGSDNQILNNLIVDAGGDAISAQPAVTVANNFTGSTVGDAGFVDPASDDYRLTQDSAAVDAGADLSQHFTFDFLREQRPRGGGFDIGALESH